MKSWLRQGVQRRALSIASVTLMASCVWFTAEAAPIIAAKPALAKAVGSWRPVGDMITPRAGHTATLLQNGRVLVAGGNGPLASAELFDPPSLTWMSTGAMQTARFYHTATLLPNGKVLVAGGRTVLPNSAPDVATAELYDPASGAWSPTGSMSIAHALHTATLLDTGEVLVVGAEFGTTVEIYDPKSERWRVVGNYGGVTDQSATLLSDGKVMVAGGCCPDHTHFAGVSLYDSLIGTWTTTGALATPRVYQVATLLPDGDVLVTGGQDSNFHDIADPEIYDHQSGKWSAAPGDSVTGALRAAVLLPSGKVLIVGGTDPTGAVIWDSISKQWALAANMTYQRAGHSTTLLPHGSVLVAGGGPARAELYDLDTSFDDRWRPTIALVTPVIVGERVGIEGSLLRGLSEASNGNGSQNSATNYPLVLLEDVDDNNLLLLSPDPLAGWTDTTFTSVPLGAFPAGAATLTVFTNGIPSMPYKVMVLSKPVGK